MPVKARRRIPHASLQRTVDSVIVHDMKNLAFRLSAVMQNMEENYDNPVFKKSMTDILGDTIRKMNAIVKRFKEQQYVVVKLRVDLNQIVRELVENLPARVLRNITVEMDLSDLPQIWGDPFYLHNAFHSLIENSVEAMPDGGTLKVKTKLIGRGKKPSVIVEISDTGVGMSQSFIANKLFHPFISTKQEGLGLGLYTSQQIFALHQGKIDVESSPGSGTTFRITLPANENATP
jgi:signal transduction histidine kinase